MKFTTILFSLAIFATTTHGMSDDMGNMTDTTAMDNTTDTTAAASSDEGGFKGFMTSMKEGWGEVKAGIACAKDDAAMYTDNAALETAWTAWDNSLKIDEALSTGGGNSSYSYTSAYSADTTAAFKEECEKVEGATFTTIADRSFKCTQQGEDKTSAWDSVTVDVSNNGFCLPGTEDCASLMTDSNITADDFGNNDLWNKLTAQGIYCEALEINFSGDDSGASTHFIGSLVAATVAVAVTVLI